MAQLSFMRVEKKFVITAQQKEDLLACLADYVQYDPYCVGDRTYNIQNIYYDTHNNTLISHSVDKPVFKQKLRARKYTGTDAYFLEIKQKYNGVVGKRRIEVSLQELENFNKNKVLPQRTSYVDSQIVEELRHFVSVYDIVPQTYISYDRLGVFWKEDSELRITFDSNIRSDRNSLQFDVKATESLLPPNHYVLEIKYNKNYPLWLAKILSKLKIYPTSYSKYGTEYRKFVKGELYQC